MHRLRIQLVYSLFFLMTTEDPTWTKPTPSGGCPMLPDGEAWLEYSDACYMYVDGRGGFAIN